MTEDYLMKLPKSRRLYELREEAQKEIGNKPILLCESQQLDAYGRYESSQGIIYFRSGLPSYIASYVIAHELCHILQEARGYPRVMLKEKLKTFTIQDNQGHEQKRPTIIWLIHEVGRALTNLVLDPGADALAYARKLQTKRALGYLCIQDRRKINDIYLPVFDGGELKKGINSYLSSLGAGRWSSVSQKVFQLLNTVRQASVYAILQLRYSPFGFFDKVDVIFGCNQPAAQKLGKELAHIVEVHDLENPTGCTEAAKQAIQYLQISGDALGIKASHKWIWPE